MADFLFGFTPASLLALLPGILSLFLLLFYLQVLRRSSAGRYFLLLSIFVFFWSLGYGFSIRAPSREALLFWIKVSTAYLLFIPSLSYLFNVSILKPGQRSGKVTLLLFVVPILFVTFHLTTNGFLKGLHHYTWGVFPHYASPFLIFLAFFLFIEVLILRDAWTHYRKAQPGVFRSRNRLLFLAWALSLSGSVDFLMGFGIKGFPLSGLATTCFILIAFLLLSRYGLNDFFEYRGLPSILQFAKDPILLVGIDGNLRNMDTATAVVLGYDHPENLIGRPVNRLFCQDTPLFLPEHVGRLAENMDSVPLEVMLQSFSGESIPARFRLSGVFNDRCELLGLVAMGRHKREETRKQQESKKINASLEEKIREVEERTRDLEEANTALQESRSSMLNILEDTEESHRRLEDAYRRLEEVDRTKDALLSSVSHELRTPLTSIRSFSEILLQYPHEDRETQKEFFEIILQESEGLTRLVNDLLDLAKIESGAICWKTDSVRIADLLHLAVRTFSILAQEKQLTIHASIQDDLPDLHLDKDRIYQVICNLLTNAIKFTPSRGSIYLSAERIQGRRFGDKNQPLVCIHVKDTGMGIPKQDLSRVFDKFHQGGDTITEKPDGTGLGLAICKEIVQHYQGSIWVESEPGEGSCFSFTLPVKCATPATAGDEENHPRAGSPETSRELQVGPLECRKEESSP